MKTEIKNQVLADLAQLIQKNAKQIIQANAIDLQQCSQTDAALYDRLKVDQKKIDTMQESINKVKQMNDPQGKVLYSYQKQADLLVENKVVPFGTLLIIYESRPDVTIEAAITAFKAGNKILLKGGKEAKNSNLLLTKLWHQALANNDQDRQWVQYLDLSREQTQELMKNNDLGIDVIIPRGGEGLINWIKHNTNIPLIISGRGNNFMYIDADADLQMAENIILDGKKRISVCNALDKVFIHPAHKIADLHGIAQAIKQAGIRLIADNNLASIADEVLTDESIMYEEFLSAKILLSQVENLQLAIEKINLYSGGHSAVIVTNNQENAQIFQEKVDCAAVYHNASTRFTDGGEFGLGAEIAISTQKLHFRGPVGLNELVTNKWFIRGTGHIRG